ncbi:MAG: hypothetical protein JWN17_2917, partial [Frankiales bacterium]|nr:hypothetical protein [Frankiales bacterium]
CAPVDGVPPPMCQSGVPVDGALPRTGRGDLPATAAGGVGALVLGAWLVVVAGRRETA